MTEPSGLEVHQAVFDRLSPAEMAQHLRTEHHLVIHEYEQDDRGTLLGKHWQVHQPGPPSAEVELHLSLIAVIGRARDVGLRPRDVRKAVEEVITTLMAS